MRFNRAYLASILAVLCLFTGFAAVLHTASTPHAVAIITAIPAILAMTLEAGWAIAAKMAPGEVLAARNDEQLSPCVCGVSCFCLSLRPSSRRHQGSLPTEWSTSRLEPCSWDLATFFPASHRIATSVFELLGRCPTRLFGFARIAALVGPWSFAGLL